MKVVYSWVKLVSYQQLKHLLLLPFLVAVAFASDDVKHLQETVESEIGYADFERMKKEVIHAIKTERSWEEEYGGAFYIRWGRTRCPRGTSEVYEGVAGGSWWHSRGGGSNYLCLPLDPTWGAYNESAAKPSKIYGSEYEYVSAFGLKNNGGRPLHNYNVPCIACLSQTRTTVMMLPARNQCYKGWHTEYTGYLMSEKSTQIARTEFICVDGQPESDPAGFRNEDGALMYNVEGVCGSLPCPPYVPSRELTCAVCTK